MAPVAGGPDDAGDGTLYADPAQLDEIERLAHEAETHDEQRAANEPPAAKWVHPWARALIAKFVEVDDAPKLDARDWPAAAGFPEQHIEHFEGIVVPPNRLRQLRFRDGRIVYEVWTPIPRKLERHELHLAANGILPIGSWRLSYHVYSPEWCSCPKATLQPHPHGLIHPECGRLKKPKVEGRFDEHVRSLQLQVNDEAIYNGYYPTIPGDDIAHINPAARPGTMEHFQGGHAIRKYNPAGPGDEYLRGGTEIRGGRAEHRRKTKGLEEMGPGYTKDAEKRAAESKAKRKAKDRLKLEKVIAKAPRKLFDV